MGSWFSKEEDPLEAEFFGMTFKCDKEHFVRLHQEEFELAFLSVYLITWAQMQVWGAIGLLWDKADMMKKILLHRWMAAVNVAGSTGLHSYASYEYHGHFGTEWMVCDKLMFKYWIIHGLARFLPDLVLFSDEDELAIINS